MKGLHRTQVLLEEVQYRYLKQIAEREGIGLSEALRRILSAYIAAAARKEEENRLADIAGIACDLQLAGRAHDSLLYPEGNR